MSSSKTTKKRNLPAIPKGDLVADSPKSNPSLEVDKVIRQAASRSLFNGNNKSTMNQSPRLQRVKTHTPVNTPSPKAMKKMDGKVETPKKKTLLAKKSIVQEEKKVDVKKQLKQQASLLLPANTSPLVEDNSSIIVAVRLRPFNTRELSYNTKNIVTMDGNMTTLRNPLNSSKNEFPFDYSFWSFNIEDSRKYTSQEDIYNAVAKPLLKSSFDGYNTCLFAYGQTGSGKSYTIMGYNDIEEGVVPRFSRSLFDKVISIQQNNSNISYSVEMSFYEIYNEKIFDLLEVVDGNRKRLCVREHPDMGPYVQGLSMHVVTNINDIKDWLEVGNKNRATAATGMNDKSSRSHSVFTIMLTQNKNEMFEGTETQLKKTSKINLIDLAGSERANQVYDERIMKDVYTANTRLKEGSCINKSLHTLGKVISLLSEAQTNPRKKNVYIPYRDSILTWLLKESLGGNARTAMLATISPSEHHYNETLSTLRYAHQARLIVNKARVNEDPKSKLIREMLNEIERLKSCQVKTGDQGNALEKEVILLREKLSETRGAFAQSTRSWQEKLESSEQKQKEATKHLRRSGISFTKLETKNPCLVNLNEDPQLAEVLLYIIHKGVTNIGSEQRDNERDIHLWGDLIASQHCSLEYDNDIVTLIATENAPTYVNGVLVVEDTLLHHGDRVVIGGDHFFRLNYPKEAIALDGSGSNNDKNLTSFQYAKEELIQNQNKRLYDELEVAKLKAENEAMLQIKEAQEKAEEDLKLQRELFLQHQQQLEDQLKLTSDERKIAEECNQTAQNTIDKLLQQKKILEEEILANRKSLQMEALAAKQALKETERSNIKIIDELEKEKMKMIKDIEIMKNTKKNNDNTRSSLTILVNNLPKYIDVSMQQDLLTLSLMTREANALCEKMGKNMVFSREDCYENGNVEHRIRITNIELCKSTVIDLCTFGDIVTRMKESTQNTNHKFNASIFDENKYTWVKDESSKKKARLTRMSLSNSSLLSSLNKSLDMTSSSQRNHSIYESTAISDVSGLNKSSTIEDDIFKLSYIPKNNDTTIISQPSTTRESDSSLTSVTSLELSNLKASMFETFLDDHQNQEISSIISRLTRLIFIAYTDWNYIIQHGAMNFSSTTMVESEDQPMLRLASNMKSIRELSYTLCKVHEAVGLDQLKDMSCTFKDNVKQACLIVKTLPHTVADKNKERMEKLMMFMIEVASALSLASVDHFESDNYETYLEKDAASELCIHFLRHQNRFLHTMIDEALSTVLSSIEVVKNLQLTCSHEMSDDLVDGVMNILTSITTLLQNCKQLLSVHADINTTSEIRLYYCKECELLRLFLTSIVDYNENIFNLTEHSKEIAKNCDNIETFLDIPIELADTTKCICKTGKELLIFVSNKKQLDDDTLALLQECYDRFEFAGKAVRVGVAIIAQEVEKDLNVQEEYSVLSVIQSDMSLSRRKSLCPLNRTNVDISVMSDNLQNTFNSSSRRSSMRSDLFISRYMDSTISVE